MPYFPFIFFIASNKFNVKQKWERKYGTILCCFQYAILISLNKGWFSSTLYIWTPSLLNITIVTVWSFIVIKTNVWLHNKCYWKSIPSEGTVGQDNLNDRLIRMKGIGINLLHGAPQISGTMQSRTSLDSSFLYSDDGGDSRRVRCIPMIFEGANGNKGCHGQWLTSARMQVFYADPIFNCGWFVGVAIIIECWVEHFFFEGNGKYGGGDRAAVLLRWWWWGEMSVLAGCRIGKLVSAAIVAYEQQRLH